jgi:hypothetical protein
LVSGVEHRSREAVAVDARDEGRRQVKTWIVVPLPFVLK